jgi:hypothetical protein
MVDWILEVSAAAENQGFQVYQSASGMWVFRKDGWTLAKMIDGPRDVVDLVRALQRMGLVLPDGKR